MLPLLRLTCLLAALLIPACAFLYVSTCLSGQPSPRSIRATERLGEEASQAGGIKKFLRTGGSSTVGPSSLSRNSASAVGGRRGGEIPIYVLVFNTWRLLGLAVAVYDRLCAAGRTSGETAERDPFNGAFGGSGSICVKLILILACRCSSNSSGRGGVLETAVFIRFSNGVRSSFGRCARRVHVSWLLRLATLAYSRGCGGISRNPFPSAAENNSADI